MRPMRIRVVCDSSFAEELAGAFAELHELEWSAEMRPGSPVRIVQILCDPAAVPQETLASLAAFLGQELTPEMMPRLALRPVRKNWDQAWKRFFRGRAVAGRFWIGPPWEVRENIPPGLVPLVIDAGTAFGTGHHPTTELVLALLAETGCDGARVLDAGTGSGVLAIAACLLGADRVTGYDIDPAATEQARTNAAANGVEGLISLHTCTIQTLPQGGPWDLILANMLPSQFAAVADQATALLAPGGRIIFSGILSEVWPGTRSLIEDCGLEVTRVIDDGKDQGGWTACLACRPLTACRL